MKIVFYRYGSICEPYLISAFQEMGIEVTELTYEITNKNLMQSECAKALSNTLMDDSYLFVFSINFFPTISDVCNIYNIRYVGWVVDSPVMELYSHSIANACNYIFIFDRSLYNEIAPLNTGHIFHMPLATSPIHMDSVIQNASVKKQKTFSSDISFVGSLYTEKSPFDKLEKPSDYLRGYLDGIMEAQLKVYGYYFIDEILPESIIQEFKEHLPGYYTPQNMDYLNDTVIVSQLYIGGKLSAMERMRSMKLLSAHFPVDIYTGSDTSQIPGIRNHGLAKTLTEMPLIFHNSTINLNITSKSIRSGIPLRIWDILGCGGFVLSNYQSEFMDIFTLGEEIETYGSMEELVEKCHYYMEHPTRALEIAHNAYERICKSHTYLHRLESILQTIL